jgi:thiamine-monophosphate kinase
LPDGLRAVADRRLHAPTPRVALGLALRGVARAAVDISDGLLGDLGHVLEASGVGASLHLPAPGRLMACGGETLDACVPPAHQLACVLAGGDDYELAFTAPPDRRDAVAAAARASATPVTRIGSVTSAAGLQVHDAHGTPHHGDWRSFDHFG